MQAFLRNGARSINSSAVQSAVFPNASPITTPRLAAKVSRQWICLDCRNQAAWGKRGGLHDSASAIQRARENRKTPPLKRRWSSTSRRLEDKATAKPANQATSDSTHPSTPDLDDAGPSNAASSSLPSHTESQRWHTSKRLAHLMDSLLSKAAIAGHHVNAYTGTDYSGIESLRREIIAQERTVKALHGAVNTAKEKYTAAHTLQAASQKEVVGLLERKHSWAAADLERYMSLIRSEHLNEQSVQAAKDDLGRAERELEDARTLLEKKERKQYHEEQIWSDTIRRNSTWVTFGLMGVNIVLLLASLAVFEPYRRRKIVREVRAALDEKAVAAPSQLVEEQIDAVVEPAVSPPETLQPPAEKSEPLLAPEPSSVAVSSKEQVGQSPLAAGEMLPEEAVEITAVPTPAAKEQLHAPSAQPGTWTATVETYQESFRDLFSERSVVLKKVDITTIALEGAATGVAVMGLLFVLLRPK